jgi:hypothetical protein
MQYSQNEPGQLFSLITKGQGQMSVTFQEGHNFDFILRDVQKFLNYFNIAKSYILVLIINPENFKSSSGGN